MQTFRPCAALGQFRARARSCVDPRTRHGDASRFERKTCSLDTHAPNKKRAAGRNGWSSFIDRVPQRMVRLRLEEPGTAFLEPKERAVHAAASVEWRVGCSDTRLLNHCGPVSLHPAGDGCGPPRTRPGSAGAASIEIGGRGCATSAGCSSRLRADRARWQTGRPIARGAGSRAKRRLDLHFCRRPARWRAGVDDGDRA